jgi:hypothetical protein
LWWWAKGRRFSRQQQKVEAKAPAPATREGKVGADFRSAELRRRSALAYQRLHTFRHAQPWPGRQTRRCAHLTAVCSTALVSPTVARMLAGASGTVACARGTTSAATDIRVRPASGSRSFTMGYPPRRLAGAELRRARRTRHQDNHPAQRGKHLRVHRLNDRDRPGCRPRLRRGISIFTNLPVSSLDRLRNGFPSGLPPLACSRTILLIRSRDRHRAWRWGKRCKASGSSTSAQAWEPPAARPGACPTIAREGAIPVGRDCGRRVCHEA